MLHATGALAAEFYNMKISELARSLILRQFQNGARESIRAILAETGIPSRRLAIETIEFPLDLTLELAEEFDLSVCLDTGHVLAGFPGWFDFFEVVEKLLPRAWPRCICMTAGKCRRACAVTARTTNRSEPATSTWAASSTGWRRRTLAVPWCLN